MVKNDKKIYVIALDDEQVDFKINVNDLKQIICFLSEWLRKTQNLPRENYKEFLHLCLLFLSVVAPENFYFREPDAYNHNK